MPKIDLHMHTAHSMDGEFEPADLVAMAAKAGMDAIAITDHNMASAVDEAVQAGKRLGLEVVPGVELDCRFRDIQVHVLGFFIDAHDPRYAGLWAGIEAQEIAASAKRTALVKKLGIHIDDQMLRERAAGRRNATRPQSGAADKIITGELLAEVALEDPRNAGNALLEPYRPGGSRSDNAQVNFYWDYCAPGKAAYVEIVYMTLPEAVRLIRESGGVAVLAHPAVNLKGHEAYLADILAEGIDGIEAYCSYHSAEDAQYWHKKAGEYGKLVTCGSDFHGKIKPAVTIGGHGGQACEGDVLEGLRALKNSCGPCAASGVLPSGICR